VCIANVLEFVGPNELTALGHLLDEQHGAVHFTGVFSFVVLDAEVQYPLIRSRLGHARVLSDRGQKFCDAVHQNVVEALFEQLLDDVLHVVLSKFRSEQRLKAPNDWEPFFVTEDPLAAHFR